MWNIAGDNHKKLVEKKNQLQKEYHFENRIFGNITSAPNDPKMTWNSARSKVIHTFYSTSLESHVPVIYQPLRWAIFQTFAVFGFDVDYNVNFLYLTTLLVQMQFKIPNHFYDDHPQEPVKCTRFGWKNITTVRVAFWIFAPIGSDVSNK